MRSKYLRWLKAVFFIIAAFLYCWLFVDHAQRPVAAWLAARKYVPVWWVSPLFFAPATALLARGCDLLLRPAGCSGIFSIHAVLGDVAQAVPVARLSLLYWLAPRRIGWVCADGVDCLKRWPMWPPR